MDYEDKATPQHNQLGAAVALGERMMELTDEVADLEAKLKQAKAALRAVAEQELVDLMDELGLSSFALSDGRAIKITEALYASVPKKNLLSAAEWLVKHGQGSLVKDDLIVHFGRGDREARDKIEALLRQQGVEDIDTAPSIHTGQVKSAIEELMARGDDVPLELFGAYIKRAATAQ